VFFILYIHWLLPFAERLFVLPMTCLADFRRFSLSFSSGCCDPLLAGMIRKTEAEVSSCQVLPDLTGFLNGIPITHDSTPDFVLYLESFCRPSFFLRLDTRGLWPLFCPLFLIRLVLGMALANSAYLRVVPYFTPYRRCPFFIVQFSIS